MTAVSVDALGKGAGLGLGLGARVTPGWRGAAECEGGRGGEVWDEKWAPVRG